MNARTTAARRELAAAERIPYTAHVSEHIVLTALGDYVQVLRLSGASFESADDDTLNTWHERLNVLLRNIASPNLALWLHVVRRRELDWPECGAGSGFSESLAQRYRSRVAGETLMVNELYLTTVYRPTVGAATTLASKFLARNAPSGMPADLTDALDVCEKLAQTLSAALERYEPELLGVYRVQGRHYSRVLEFFSFLITNERQRVPLPRGPVNRALATTRLFFGIETIEYRLPTATRVGAMLGIKEYPTPSVVGMFDRLLSAHFSFVLTQSFTFLGKSTAQRLLQRQGHRLANAGDFAVSQTEELRVALDELTSNEFTMGDHHFSLQVLTDLDEEGPGGQGARRLRSLNDHVALARALLADTGMIVAREDLALEGAFWAQLPGHFAMRPRKAPITSRNLAAMAPFHNFPTGRATGNHWGDAVTLLVTSARSPYYFSLHASDPTDPEGGGRRDTGHTFICGPTGSGKTVLIGFLMAMLARRDVTQIVFDKDRGLEILVRALGGVYLPLRNGEPTGCNPLQLPESPNALEFQKAWLRLLIRGASPLVTREETNLDQALRGTLELAPAARRLSRLIEFTDPTRPDGIHARLMRWCESAGGDYAAVFDNAHDRIVPHLAGHTTIGFDVTDFLDNEVARAPLTLYLFHLVRQLLDGRKLVCWMDEFWRLLADPAFESFAKDGPRTWRKLNGVMCLATQTAGDVLESPISRTIVEQTPTKVFFPNADASHADYVEGLGLSEREFRLVKEELEPRMFLVKQGHHSIVCQLDLKGFDGELAVISGRAGELARLHTLMEAYGDDPAAWLSQFHPALGLNKE